MYANICVKTTLLSCKRIFEEVCSRDVWMAVTAVDSVGAVLKTGQKSLGRMDGGRMMSFVMRLGMK